MGVSSFTFAGAGVPPATAQLALPPAEFILGRHTPGGVRDYVRNDRLQQHAADPHPERRALGNEEAARADPKQEHDKGGDLQPGHALGLLGTM